MNENNATVMYEKRFFKTIGKIVKKKVELVGNFVSVLQAVKCQIPLVVMMGSKDEAFDIERSLNAMLGAHQNFKSMPEIKLLKAIASLQTSRPATVSPPLLFILRMRRVSSSTLWSSF